MTETPLEILVLFLKSTVHQKIIHYDIVSGDEGYTINSSQQTVEQFEVIQVVVLPEVSKLNDSVIK